MSLKLVGYTTIAECMDTAAFAAVVRNELISIREMLGSDMIVLSSPKNLTDITFLRTCIELRIPTIVLLSSENHLPDERDSESSALLSHLLSVTLAKYPISNSESHLSILEWADALICTSLDKDNEVLSDALAIGTPTKTIHPSSLDAHWSHPPQATSPAKHGFPTRRELLEFFDGRFGEWSRRPD